MAWLKLKSNRTALRNPMVEAAVLMRWCEEWLPREQFSTIHETQFKAISKLLHFTKVGFVLHWLSGAIRQSKFSLRAQEILTNFQIIFDPDSYEQAGTEEQSQIAKFLDDVGIRAFELVHISMESKAADAEYFSKLRVWCTEWMAFSIEEDSEIAEIYGHVGPMLVAVLLGELSEIRKALTNAVQGTTSGGPSV